MEQVALSLLPGWPLCSTFSVVEFLTFICDERVLHSFHTSQQSFPSLSGPVVGEMSFCAQSPVYMSSRISNNTLKDSIFSEKEETSDTTDHERGLAERRSLIDDVEVQPVFTSVTGSPQSQSSTLEDSIPAKRKLVYLAGYFLLNLSLTIYNKAVLGAVSLALFSYLRITC